MTTTVKLTKPFRLQYEILKHPARYKVLAIGRQWGKSELSVIDGVHRMLRGQAMWFCSPTNKNNKRMYPKFKRVMKAIPDVYTHDTDMIIRLPNGGFIQFVSLEQPDNLRGEGLHHMYIDEAAFIKKGTYDTVLRPMLAARRGSVWFMSSPNGQNEFWHWMRRGQDPLNEDWKSWHLPSSSSPVLAQEELDEIARDTPSRVFRQEYLAEFLEDGGAVFRNLQVCVGDAPRAKPKPKRIVMGVDWARHNDYTVLTVMDADSGAVLEIDRFNQIDWTTQRDRLIALHDKYDVQQVIAEANSIGEPNIEELRKRNIRTHAFTTTQKSKADIIQALALAFEQESITIPNDPVLLGELQAYTLERLPSGNYRYNAPTGMHDDMVMSLALAWHGVISHKPVFVITA